MSERDSQYHEFTALLREHERLVYKVSGLYTTDAEDRKDLFQEIVLQAWISYPRFKGASKISTWLYRVALNTALGHKRKKRSHITGNDELLLLHAEEAGHDAYAEEYGIMHQMIAELPALEKALILLYLEDHSYRDIAEILGISESNVGTKLNRIKDKMKKQAPAYRS